MKVIKVHCYFVLDFDFYCMNKNSLQNILFGFPKTTKRQEQHEGETEVMTNLIFS